jgi:hypothetical protein
VSRLGNVAMAVAARAVLGRLGRSDRAQPPATRAPARDAPAAAPRRRLLVLMLGSFVAAVALMVPFELPLTRALGVIALFTFIVSGVFLIADPDWLDRDDE